ncbi:hypothetical protein BO71DRAFT_253644 [Aspergillus ellipticus CBS 707.79]|uniref:Uncharacterized protein n=1 Tax=Aspergillus ellipticus CBS 707.79 TaxID=1448320 RepID=A0A319D7R6_9EURO|nr:hypothetical protein BO71DRAFT_253644 [Aspergillus ellipticus CBS 707.79]
MRASPAGSQGSIAVASMSADACNKIHTGCPLAWEPAYGILELDFRDGRNTACDREILEVDASWYRMYQDKGWVGIKALWTGRGLFFSAARMPWCLQASILLNRWAGDARYACAAVHQCRRACVDAIIVHAWPALTGSSLQAVPTYLGTWEVPYFGRRSVRAPPSRTGPGQA